MNRRIDAQYIPFHSDPVPPGDFAFQTRYPLDPHSLDPLSFTSSLSLVILRSKLATPFGILSPILSPLLHRSAW